MQKGKESRPKTGTRDGEEVSPLGGRLPNGGTRFNDDNARRTANGSEPSFRHGRLGSRNGQAFQKDQHRLCGVSKVNLANSEFSAPSLIY